MKYKMPKNLDCHFKEDLNKEKLTCNVRDFPSDSDEAGHPDKEYDKNQACIMRYHLMIFLQHNLIMNLAAQIDSF